MVSVPESIFDVVMVGVLEIVYEVVIGRVVNVGRCRVSEFIGDVE